MFYSVNAIRINADSPAPGMVATLARFLIKVSLHRRVNRNDAII